MDNDDQHDIITLNDPSNQRPVELREALNELLDWAQSMGGWEAPCWQRAERALGISRMRSSKRSQTALKYVQAAKHDYCDCTDDIAINSTPAVSEVEEGAWVQAWVWVSRGRLDEDLG